MGVQGIPSLVDMKIPKECYFSFIAAKVFSKIHLYIPVVLVTPKYQSWQNELSETKAEKDEVWFSSHRQMPTAFSTGSAFYK